MCKFELAWIGTCNVEANDSGFCSEHENIKCCSCGDKATRECSETMGLVCGAPLCGTCEHTIRDNGCNSGGILPEGLRGHCKPEEQVYNPWFISKDK